MAIPTATQTMSAFGASKESIAAGIHVEDFPFLADALNGLYSDVIMAPLREVSTNAWDSHVDARNHRPIEVTLPSEESLFLTIQDFGLGMSIDDLRNTYAFYGASSKRDSNDVAGQLGLGSKSPLSYTDGFTITAVKNHEKVVAFFTKDERGLGVIQIMVNPHATDEGNGVAIQIPVKSHDVDDFATAAENLFRFWSPGTVLVNGEAPETPKWHEGALHLDDDTMVVRKDAGLDSSYVIMGNVAYPVADAQVGRTSRRFVARINIGDVDFVPSREAVKHTTHTDKTLSDLNDYIKRHFNRILDSTLADAESRWVETQTRVLWGGTDLTLRAADPDYRIWTYQPDRRWGRKTEAKLTYDIKALANAQGTSTAVITGYKAKALSATAKDRLVEMFGSTTFFVVLPSGTASVGLLDGRPNTYTWNDVVEATKAPKGERAARGPKTETVYNTNRYGMTAAEIDAYDGKVLFLLPGERSHKGSMDALVVNLYSVNQEARIRRLVPRIEHYDVEVERQTIAATKAITDADRAIAQAKTLPSNFGYLDADQIDDPDLAATIRLRNADDTATMTKAKHFGVEITFAPLPDYAKRYPLAMGSHHSLDAKDVITERTFYINARYKADHLNAFLNSMSQGAA